MMTRRPVFAAVLLALALAACGRAGAPQGGETPGEIHFAVLSTDRAPTSVAAWQAIRADMARRTGLKVKLQVYADSAALTEALRRKTVDAGLASNRSGLDAVRRAGAEVFARTDAPVSADEHAAVLITGVARNLTLERALGCRRTLTLGMGEASSAAGALAPMTYLFAPRDIDPQTCFKRVGVGAGSASDLAAVAQGTLDLALVDSDALATDSARAAVVTELWRSPPLPQNPLIRRKSLDPVIKEKLRQFFLTYGRGASPETIKARAVLARVGVGGFKPADDTHLLPIREMEATSAWYGAKRGGDAAKIAAAQAALDAITAQRVTLEARTRAPAAAQ